MLLNLLQFGSLFLTTFINFGGLALNYFAVVRELAVTQDNAVGVTSISAKIDIVQVALQVFTFGIVLMFLGVGIEQGIRSCVTKSQHVIERVGERSRSRGDRGVEMTESANPMYSHGNGNRAHRDAHALSIVQPNAPVAGMFLFEYGRTRVPVLCNEREI